MTALAVVETGEVVEAMSTVEAERITARIADKLDAIADNLEQVLPLIGEALTRRAWEVLGYASPTAYVAERFAGALDRLSPEVRRPVVAQLSAAGMSTRAIAPVVGIDRRNVSRDLQHVGRTAPPAPSRTVTDAPDAVQPAAGPDEAAPFSLPQSDHITGSDGKKYPRPEAPALADDASDPAPARKTKRRPITDVARDAGLNLHKVSGQLERLMADDRFSGNKSEVAAHLRHHLAHATEVLQDLNSRINQ